MRSSTRVWMVLGALVGLLATGPAAAAAPGDLGTEDFSYAPLTGSPTQTKPESKLWFADGSWWGDLYSPSAGVHRIHRFDAGADRWVDTGTTLDNRPNANADILWHAASRKLYVASHVFTQVSAPAPPSQSGRVYRYSYDPATRSYSLDPGFPVVINGARTEALVMDMDSTGRLWATWLHDAVIYATHTDGDDTHWSPPHVVSQPVVPYHSDDISALVAFGGNKIGVMFSSQFLGIHRMYFAVHQDGAGDALSDWSVDFVHGIPTGNDHINLKADRAGRVFAATKTTELQPSSPRLLLLRRDAAGNWSNTVFGTEAEAHTRPIVLLEDPGDQAHMLAACPQPPAKPRADSGGDICEKTTSVDNLGFAPGIGTPVMRDASSPELNDVTSTKQPVNSATGMLLMANNPTDGIDAYWHRFLPLSTPAPPPVAAAFVAASDAADPLAVHFRDTSTGAATSWLWDFGDGATSKAHHPTHRFAQAGQYTVRLTAASATSTNTTTVTQTVPVTTPVPAAGVAASRVPAPVTAARPRPAARYRPSLSLSQRAVQRGRIRLSGSVSRRLTGVRVVLERRIGANRWRAVATTRLLSLGQARSRFAFVLRRRSHTTVFRVVLPAKGNRSRAASRALTVRPRR